MHVPVSGRLRLEDYAVSAHFIIKFRGQALRRVNERTMAVCDPAEATGYTSEAEAWLAARRQGLDLDQVSIECLSGRAVRDAIPTSHFSLLTSS